MHNITSSELLENAIQELEMEQTVKLHNLKEQLHLTFESLKPVNIVVNTLKDIASSPVLTDNIFSNILGLSTGYLSKKIIVGKSRNVFKNILGSVLQYGISNFVSNHAEAIKTIGNSFFQNFIAKKKSNTHTP